MQKQQPETLDFNEKVVGFLIENSDNKFVELPNLYDSLPKKIIDKDENEKLILVQILKNRGFKIKDWGRGNHPLGPRIINIKLEKGNCLCEVQKIYYSSYNLPDEIYKITESIRCNKASQ